MPSSPAAASDFFNSLLAPADERVIATELGRLRLSTVSRDPGQIDLTIAIDIYTDELRAYPTDLVRHVLREWPRSGNKFWPTLAELIEPLRRLVKPRQALRDALRRGYQQPETSPASVKPTPAQKAEVEDLLRKHGFAIDGAGRARPPEHPPLTAEQRKAVADELRHFRLPDPNDPRILARLRAMGIEPEKEGRP